MSVNNNLLKAFATQKVDEYMPKKTRYLPTGFDAFDTDVLKVGGLPFGFMTHIYGPDGGGKTTLALRLIAQAQRLYPDHAVVYIDSEYRFNADWAVKQGVDISPISKGGTLRIIQENVAEKVLEEVKKCILTGVVSLIVVDSIGQLYPEQEIDYSKANTPGLFAKIVTKYLSPLTKLIHEYDICFVCLNQLRDKIGVLYGSPEDFPGGRKFKHTMHLSIRVRKIKDLIEGGNIVGCVIGGSVRKSGVAVAGTSDDNSHMVFYNEGGPEKSLLYGLFDKAVRLGIIVRGGAWYKILDISGDLIEKYKGRDGIMDAMISDSTMQDKVRSLIYEYERQGSTLSNTTVHEFETDEFSGE